MRAEVRASLKALLIRVSRAVWRYPLDRAATVDLLLRAVVWREPPAAFDFPALPSTSGNVFPYFLARSARLDPNYVWDLRAGEHVRSIRICRSGTVCVDRKFLLNLDFGATPGILEPPFARSKGSLPIAIVPWSHRYGTYHDYVMFVLTKLCRIQEHIGRDIWQKALVCYPLFRTAFEREFLAALGIPGQNVVDTGGWRGSVEADRVLLANNQPWFTPSPQDLARLRRRFCSPAPARPERRLYVARAHRRRVRNEAAAREVLRHFGFEVVEDRPRTVEEQVRLFQEASVVVGPHGAGLTNIIWCEPGAQVLEMFHHRFAPPYFCYLSALLGHSYQYIVDGPPPRRRRARSHDSDQISPPIHPAGNGLSATLLAHATDDMDVDIDDLERALRQCSRSRPVIPRSTSWSASRATTK